MQTTTRVERAARVAPDLVQRDFTAARADRLWVADITYVPTWSGFLYLAVALDAWRRRVVGWSMATHLCTQLVLGVGHGDLAAASAWRGASQRPRLAVPLDRVRGAVPGG